MADWHDFFLAAAGAVAVLAGLVFVGVSINLEMIMTTPSSGLVGRALDALVLLMAVLIPLYCWCRRRGWCLLE
jgi:hypothetical protein